MGEGGGPRQGTLMFTWGNTSVSLLPPASAQAKALVSMAEHFGWRRCRLIQGSEAEYAEMGESFLAEASALELDVLERVVLPPATDASRAQTLASLRSADDCQARVLVLCLSALDAEAVFEALMEDGAWSGKWVFLGSATVAHAKASVLPRGLLAVRSVAQADSQWFVDLSLHLQATHGSDAPVGGTGVDETGKVEGEAAGGSRLVDDEAFFAFDAFLALCMVVWRMYVHGKDLSSPAALREALLEVDFNGATGQVRFDEKGQRDGGRFALLNWDGARWTSLAVWDLERRGLVIHTKLATLRQSEWEQQAVVWSSHLGGKKPPDVCQCVLFSAIPAAGMDLRSCAWSAEAVAVTVLMVCAALVCVACCVRWWRRRTKSVDVEEELVQQEVLKLRARLHIRRSDGFILSTEPQRARWWLPQHAQLQRTHVEAAARMTLLLEFDVRAVNALASSLYCSELYQHGDSTGDHQYEELRELVLELARQLLQPCAGSPNAPEFRSRSNSDAGSVNSMASGHSHNSRVTWLRRQPRSVRQDQPRSPEERFHYFIAYVSKLQLWAEDGGSLFKELQSTVVQELMGRLRDRCDQQYQSIIEEEGGAALAAFRWPQSHALLPQVANRAVLDGAELGSCPAGHQEEDIQRRTSSVALAWPDKANAQHGGEDATAPCSRAPSCQPQDAHSSASERSASGRRLHHPFHYASITRQDHPQVGAIRRDAEDEREVEMQRGAQSVGSVHALLDEDVYLTALHRRALLLNEGFQAAVREAIEHQFGAHPVLMTLRPTPSAQDGGSPGVHRLATDFSHTLLLEHRVHSAPVKTMARMREKLIEYACAPASPLSSAAATGATSQEVGGRNVHAHPLAANLLDPIRCTVVCRGPREILETAQWLIDEGETVGLPVVRVKNKFGLANADEYDGYRDMMACVLYTAKNGLKIVGEIQFHDFRLHELKMQMHKLYKVKRAHAADLI